MDQGVLEPDMFQISERLQTNGGYYKGNRETTI